MDILHKAWSVTTPAQKKLFARILTHRLSRKLDKKSFEVIYEGYLDLKNDESEQPDVVVYSLNQQLTPVVAIEFCKSEEVFEMKILAKHIVENFHLKEFFIFDLTNKSWYCISRGHDGISSYSNQLCVDLSDSLILFPQGGNFLPA